MCDTTATLLSTAAFANKISKTKTKLIKAKEVEKINEVMACDVLPVAIFSATIVSNWSL